MNARTRQKTILTAVMMGAVIFLAAFSVNPARGEEDKTRYRVTGDVYFGDRYQFSKPCVLSRKKVFEKIPEYQTIVRERLNKHSARYHLLIEQANRVFRSKIKEALEELGYDLVVEKKGIKTRGVKIPDISKEVIAKITG